MRTREARVGTAVEWKECTGVVGVITEVQKEKAHVKFSGTGVVVEFDIKDLNIRGKGSEVTHKL